MLQAEVRIIQHVMTQIAVRRFGPDYEGAIAAEGDAATAQYWSDILHNVTEVGYGEPDNPQSGS